MILRRRRFVAAMGGVLVAPLAALAQPGRRMRIGYVDNTIPLQELAHSPRDVNTQAFVDALKDAGWVEGKNLEILWRSAEGVVERRPAILEELVKLKVDAIVVFGDYATMDAMSRTRTIPIVMATSVFPVERNLVASLARPGGNVTGMTLTVQGSAIGVKRIALLKDAAPHVTHLGWLHPTPRVAETPDDDFLKAVSAVGVKFGLIPFEGVSALDGALAQARRQGVNGLVIGIYTFFADPRNHQGIREGIERHRLPAIAANHRTNLGAILNHAPDPRPLHVGAAGYVDRILRGAKPGDLPLEQPRAFKLIANVGAARRIGLTLPQTILALADQVIE